MERNYRNGAQKRQVKRRKIAEPGRNSHRLSSWLTRPETTKADEQNVSICETENSGTTKDRLNASKNDGFSTIRPIVNYGTKNAIIAAVPK